jgi:hypothetical protein
MAVDQRLSLENSLGAIKTQLEKRRSEVLIRQAGRGTPALSHGAAQLPQWSENLRKAKGEQRGQTQDGKEE